MKHWGSRASGVLLLSLLTATAYGLNYTYYSDEELTRFGDRIKFWPGDSVAGPIRTNGCFAWIGTPCFQDWVIMGCEIDPDSLPPQGRFVTGAPELPPPEQAVWVRTEALAQGHFFAGGDSLWARVRIGDHNLRIAWTTVGEPMDTAQAVDYPLPDSAVVFFDCPQVNLTGVLHTVLIFGTRGRVGLEDNVLYESADPLTGVAPAGHPEKLAVIAEGEIKVLNTIANGRNNSSGLGNNQTNPSLTSIILDGIYVALDESFTFEQQNDPDPDSGYVFCTPPQTGPDDRGVVRLYGSILQTRRGYVHRSTCQSTGYLKHYRTDRDLLFWDLHLFPEARENTFDRAAVDFGEVAVGAAAMDTVTLFNDFVPIRLDSLQAAPPFMVAPAEGDSARWSQRLVVGYAPTEPGEHNGELAVTINYYGRSYTLPLSGRATPAAAGGTPAMPGVFALSAGPNPYNAVTVLRFTLPAASRVTLAVYDLLGRKVLTLQDEWLAAGTHAVPLAAGALPSGLYFAQLESPDQTATLKLALIK